MPEENDETITNPTPEPDKVITNVEDKLDDDKGNLTVHDLNALKEELDAKIRSIRSDKDKDAQEKSELYAKIDKLSEHIEEMRKAQEAKDSDVDSKTTIVVPPEHLNPPIQQNPIPPEQVQDSDGETKKKKMRWW